MQMLTMVLVRKILFVALILFLSFWSHAQTGPGGYGKTDGSTNLVLWLKADVGVEEADASVPEDTDPITLWNDQSGYGNNAIVGGGTPSYNVSDAGFGNRPSIQFVDGDTEWLQVADADELDDTDEISIFYVYRPDNGSGTRAHLSKRNGNNNQQSYVFFENGSQNSRINNRNDAGAGINGGTTYINSITYEPNSFNHFLNQAVGGPVSGAGASIANNASNLQIGAFNPGDNRTFDGRMAEIIIFREYLTDAQRIVVETYLASKYGISLTDDYWDEVAYSGYNNEIAGIGQSDLGSVANSATSSILTISGGSDREDGEWLFWGHDNASISGYTTLETVSNRLAREWVVDTTGNMGMVTINVAAADLPNTNLAAPNFNLLVDDDGDFSAGVTSYNMTLNGSNYEVAVNLSAGQRMTISYDAPAPAGVSAGLAFWLDADGGAENGSSNPAADGENVAVWQDLSSNNTDGQNGTSPVYNTSSPLNFRPTVVFDAANSEYLQIDISEFESSDFTIMGVVRRASNTANQNIIGSATNVTGAMSLGYSTNTQLDGRTNSTSTVSTTVGGFGSPSAQAAIVALTYQGSGTSLKVDQFRNGAASTTTNNSASAYTSSIQGNIGRALAGNYFDGDIAELVAFPTALSTTDFNALSSNLAIQYGISTGVDYVDENGLVLWDYSVSNTDGFIEDVAAIGFDESFALDQRVSKSATDSIVLATSADFSSLTNNPGRPALGDGEFVFIANDDDPYNLDQPFNGANNTRLDRTWRVDETGTPGAVVVAIPTSVATLNFMLVSTNDDFTTDPVVQVALIESGGYYYATHDFSDGDYFTFGFDDTEIWYSYKSGVWSDWTNWTLDGAVSALLVNPDNKIPLPGDSVVIKSGKTITADVSDIAVELMEINGTLDLATTGGHNFNYIFGFGKMRMAGNGGFDNYPNGVDTLFYDRDEGGTVEIYGSGMTLDQDRNFRNLIINLNADTDIATMTAPSIALTKDLTITRGALRFNDNSSTSSVNLAVNGNILIEEDGSMLVGTGNARHELDLLGDFTNQGLVELTNRTSPNYTSEATDGIVDLNFVSNDQDQALRLENVARLYRIEIDKGVDDSYIVDITADDPSYFNLLGFANQSHPQDNQLVSSSNQNSNALGLYFGTVKIGTNVNIPRLNGGGNYNISEGAQIWVDGGSVTKNQGTAIVPYGTIRITSGTIEANINSGITTRGNATLIIEGGTVTVRQFRTSIFGATNQGGLVMTGGVFNVLGATAGGINNDYTPFNLTYEGNVFNLSGGTLNIAGPNSKGGLFIGSNPENVSTIGGVVNLEIDNSNDFIIATRASFYDLTMTKTTGSGSGEFTIQELTTGSGGSANRTVVQQPLRIVNDLTIADVGNNTVFDANGNDVNITGTLTVQNGATMTMSNNTLRFEGLGTSFVDIQTTGPLALDSLEINKTLDTDLVRVTNGPDRAITIASYFKHQSGQFDYLADTIVLSGELVVNDTIGLPTSTGELLLNGVSRQTITSAGGYIYDLVLDNAGDSLSGNLVVDSLVLDGGVFDIGRFSLTVASDMSTNTGYGSSCMIQTNGNASDGGLRLYIDALDTYLFPVGTDKNAALRYTPADITLNSFTDDGYIAVSPSDIELATLNIAGTNALSYYWAVRHTDFTTPPQVTSIAFTYADSDTHTGSQLVDADNYFPGKVLASVPYTRTVLSTEIINTNTFLYDADGSPFTLANDNFTAGTVDKFSGSIRIFYCRTDDESDNWNSASNWSTVGPDSGVNTFSTYPQAGDVAIISYSATQTGNNKRRRIRINTGATVTVAELILEQNPDAGLIESRNSRLVIPDNPGTGLTVTGAVSGDGEIQYRMRGSYQPVLNFGDLGGFVNNENASWIMRADSPDDIVVPQISDTYPRLSIVGDGGSQDNSVIFDHDITCRNMNIRFAGTLKMNDGAEGDITILDSLRLGTIGGSWSGDLMFQSDGIGRILTVGGDIIIDSDDPPNAAAGPADFFVETGGSTNVIHQVNVGGSIIIRDDASLDGTFDLYTDNSGGANAILRFFGNSSEQFVNSTSNTPDLFRLVMDKGTDTTSVLTIQDNIALNASNTSNPQSIELLKGKLVLNDPVIDFELANASEFIIPLGAGLEVTQGTVTATSDASINLDGLLRINGGTVTLNDSDIIYSNTGEALIDVSSGSLTVGNQIRRPITSSSGILKYRQSGGTVLIGADGQSENGRAMFEVLNPGSEFTLTGGDFTIRRGVTGDDNPSLELLPEVYDVTGSTITLGDANTPNIGGSNFFNIKTAIPLNNLTIDDDADFPIARAFSLAMTIDGTLEIQTNGDFDANGFQITLNGDLDNEGTYTNDDDLTLFGAAGAQEIRGGGSFTFFDVTKNNTGTLTQSTGPIAINNDLRVEDGTLALGGNLMELKGDAYIESIVSNTAGGYLSFNSNFNNQNLYGKANNTITLGKIQIDNPLGVDITDGFGYNFDLTEELALLEGVFNVGGSLVTIKEGAFITGDLGGTAFSDFSINNMVQTNSSFVDNGLKIEYGEVFQSPDSTIIFPIGEQKYTPVTITLNQGTDDGKIRVRPANERHPTINDDLSTPGQNEADSVLQYYWIVVAEDISAATGLATFYYDHDDVALDSDTAKYQSARLLEGDILWDKAYDPDDFEGMPDQKFNIALVGYASAEITGDYTAGIGDFIPDAVPQYVSSASSLSANYNDNVWVDENSDPVTINPAIGPIGGSVTISSGDTISINVNNVRLYETIIEEGGVLIIDPSSFGHRLGNVRGTGTIQLNGTGELPAGEYSAFFDCTGGAIDYSGTGDYNVLGAVSQIRKVSFTGTGQRIMPNNILEVCDTLYVNGPTLGPSLALNTGQTITVGSVSTPNDLFWIENGAVTLSNSTTLDVNGSVDFEGGSFTGGSGTTIFIYENLTRTGTTLNWNNTTVRFDGAAPQTITGNFKGSRAFDNIRINNASATGITIVGDVDIDGLLTFQDGHFYTSANDSLRLTVSGTKTGASANSHVKGPMIKNSVAASSSYTFPVGKGNRYAPVTIVDVGTGSDNWKAEYFQTNLNGTSAFDPADVGSGRGALTGISNDMWRVQSAGTNTAKIRVNYGSWHDSSDPGALRLAWWDAVGPNTSPAGPRWENQGGIVVVNTASTGTVTSETIIGFSTQDFTLGATSEDALPVEMLYFQGMEDKGTVYLDWATATEIDNDHFEVQRSQDGRDWEVIGVVGGAGTTVEKQTYTFADTRPYVGNSYYRLRQVDYDGKFAYTELILISVKLEAVSFNVYPNPVMDQFTVDIKGINAGEIAPYSIISLQGAFIGQGELVTDEAGRINQEISLGINQPAGIYILRIQTAQRVFRFNLIKK